MKRAIAFIGALLSLGFLSASALANYLFGASLGRTPREALLYGAVGVLAVAMNALAPFFISWSLEDGRRMTATATGVIWALCLTYSITSALGFAAQNREATAVAQQISRDAYDDTHRELLDLEARRNDARGKERARLERTIDDARARLHGLRSQTIPAPDAQSAFLSSLSLGLLDARQIRRALVALFAIMVELCATLGLFSALSHARDKLPAPRPRSRWIS